MHSVAVHVECPAKTLVGGRTRRCSQALRNFSFILHQGYETENVPDSCLGVRFILDCVVDAEVHVQRFVGGALLPFPESDRPLR
jgi:hypothetical protein